MKRKIKISVLISAFAVSAMIYISNRSLGITEIMVKDENIPSDFNGFTIIQISDFHNAEFGNKQSDITRMINAENPDIIVITGDLIDSRRTYIERALALIDGLDNEIPVYYVTGNHESRIDDYKILESGLIERGVKVLRNKNEVITVNGSSISLIGIDDPSFGYTDEDILETIASLKDDNYTILLSHRPELIDIYSRAGTDLVLSGHAHGGQFRIPLVGGVIAPGQGFFPKYTAGIYKYEQIQMIVSRGVGNSIIPVRINNPSELVKIILNNKE